MTPTKEFEAHLSKNSPVQIKPVPEGINRPLWSVMIPTFNCAKYLRQTLESVLSQAPGPEQMQIEVVDDCSTLDDPEAVVQEVGQGRVAFYRKPKNVGATENFIACIQRSSGHFIQVLHGDDYVLPGFYQHIETAAAQFPNCSLYATRAFFVTESNIIDSVSIRCPGMESSSHKTSDFWFACPIQFAGIVVRRSLYEQQGGFRPSLIHSADWEMWGRAVHYGGGVILPEVLACYRVFEGNDTSRLKKTAANLRDHLACMRFFASYIPEYPLPRALIALSNLALEQEYVMRTAGETAAAVAALSFYEEITPWPRRFKRAMRRMIYRLFH